MIKVCYSEQDTPGGPLLRLEAAGHACYAPAGQDIVCAGASTLMQALVYLLAGEANAKADAWDEPDGPRLAVSVAPPAEQWVSGAFELAKAGFALLAERYPEHLRFADISRKGEAAMLDLQMFAEGGGTGGEGAAEAAAPELSRAQAKQAAASGTLKPAAKAAPAAPARAAENVPKAESAPEPEHPQPPLPPRVNPTPLPRAQMAAVNALHARWAAEEAALRRSRPEFSLKAELRGPEMRRLMSLPGMRVEDAYRLAHYNDELARAARAVEQGVMERIAQRGARAAENGAHGGSAAVSRPDVSRMTRAEREALEQRALHGATINL